MEKKEELNDLFGDLMNKVSKPLPIFTPDEKYFKEDEYKKRKKKMKEARKARRRNKRGK